MGTTSDNGATILGEAAMTALEQPTAEAKSLPTEAYTSPEFLRLENERLFARTWTLVTVVPSVS